MNAIDNTTIETHPLYPKIKLLIERLKVNNIIEQGSRYCFAMSDITQNILKELGIKSHLQEVELTILNAKETMFCIVGLQTDVAPDPNTVNTHVVVIVEHEQPLLLDFSIKHLLKHPLSYVCGLCVYENDKIIGQFEHEDYKFIYRQKTNSNLLGVHHQSIIDRIKTDKELQKSIAQNRKLSIGIIISLLFAACMMTYNYENISAASQRAYTNRQLIARQEDRINDLYLQIGRLQGQEKK